MRRPLALLVLSLVLAGCSGGGGTDPQTGDQGLTPPVDAAAGSNGSAPAPLVTEVAVDWDGHLVNGAWWCEGIVFGGCDAAPADAAFGVDHVLEGLAGNVSGDLELAWTANNAVTDQLVLDAAVLTPGCDDCPFTQVGHTAGLSPLRISLDTPLAPGEVLRLSAYVDKYVQAPLATVGASGDQDFTVAGRLATLP